MNACLVLCRPLQYVQQTYSELVGYQAFFSMDKIPEERKLHSST